MRSRKEVADIVVRLQGKFEADELLVNLVSVEISLLLDIRELLQEAKNK